VSLARDVGAAIRFARRELRGGLRGFRIFVACLALGVAAIAAVNSVSESIQAGLRTDARKLHGSDLTLRATYAPATPEERAWIDGLGRVSEGVAMRAMARATDRATLVELKAVDGLYPLYGELLLDPEATASDALTRRDGVWGAIAEETLMVKLGVVVGDRLRLGDIEVELRGIIEREPDRATGLFNFGPRLMIAVDAVPETGLIQPGSVIRYHYRIGLPPGADVDAAARAVEARFPDTGWRVSTFDDTAPGLRRTIERLTLFLTLVGLTALLIGGIGVANAVRAYIGGKTATIATLKCLGAPSRVVFLTYLMQVLALASVGIAVGLALGGLAPFLLSDLLAGLLPVQLGVGVYPGALALAAAFGLLTTLAFSLWPLARAQEIPAASLFRDLVAHTHAVPRPAQIAAIALAGGGLAALAILTAQDRVLAAWFVGGTVGALLVFLGCAWAVMRGAGALGRPRLPSLRLALSNLCRPGAPTTSVVLSLGFGVTVLVAIALVEGNLHRQIARDLPSRAPAYFFIDIQPDQVDRFAAVAEAVPGVGEVRRLPHLRARITHIDGRPLDERAVAEGTRWAVRNERGLTYAAEPPEEARIVAGEWWPTDYSGPPLISFDANLAEGFGIGIGDTLTFNVLGREIEARIANLRAIDWSTLQMQFSTIFAPGTLEPAPQTFIATVYAAPAAEGPLVRAVGDALPNVSAIRVREALEAVNRIVAQIGVAVRATASITLLAGALVLGGAVAAGQRRRIYESVVLKVLGATRGDILSAYLMEFMLLGLITAAIGAAVGTLAGWAVLTHVMNLEWTFLPGAVAATGAACLAVTVAFGFVGVWFALGRKAAPMLRSP